MSLQNALSAVQEQLLHPGYQARRAAFAQRFGGRHAALLRDLDASLGQLRARQDPIPLSLMDALPPQFGVTLRGLAPEERGAVAKEIVSMHFDALAGVLAQPDLPASIADQYGAALGYIVPSLIDEPDADYGNMSTSSFDRDLRIASGFSLPLGSQILDLRVWAPTSFWRNQGLATNLRCLAFIKLQLGGLGPLVRIHADSRNLANFNEAGRALCYERVAQLMLARPDIRGLIGTSWYLDPQIPRISPKLAYLSRVPLDHGAFLRIDGPGEMHTRRAIERSPTRKRLYEEGSFKPVCATMIWPRKRLIDWARERGAV